MSTHIYAFGSICRGEFDEMSDIDLLAITTEDDKRFSTEKFSVYTHERISELWREGNPFAWHLHLESSLIHSSDKVDFLKSLLNPEKYENGYNDCQKFKALFEDNFKALLDNTNSSTFKISCIFLGVRNFATCYSLAKGKPIFSRKSPTLIKNHLNISTNVFDILIRARILSTRGTGKPLTKSEIDLVKVECQKIHQWMEKLIKELIYE